MIDGLNNRSFLVSRSFFAGMVSAAVALSVGELFASVSNRSISLVYAVGEFIIDITPGDVVRGSIETLGNYQKVVLLCSIALLSIIFGGILGVLSRRHSEKSYLLFIGFGIFGAWTLNRDPLTTTSAALSLSVSATLIGISSLLFLNSLLSDEEEQNFEDPRNTYANRRQFINWATGMTVAAGTLTGVGRVLLRDDTVRNIRENIVLPNVKEEKDLLINESIPEKTTLASTTTTPSEGSDLLSFSEMNEIEGISPYITSNDDFYRIDTALRVPTIEPSGWSLRIDGLVDNPYEISYDEILKMDLVKKDVTLTCVSNEIGGPLVGNAVWTGVPLDQIVSKAEPSATSEQIMCHSVDGFTAGFPLENIFDGRTALLAVGMNGAPLPIIHGFPARLVVAGLYGYVSAVKWIKRIELCTWNDNDGYWIPRGWSKRAPIKISSRIDVPQKRKIDSGMHVVAGVAWAPLSGVKTVEISFDSGPWKKCDLGLSLSGESWTQWVYKWEAEPGKYEIKVRATDKNGVVQSSNIVSPAPNGAEGLDKISIRVV